MKIKTVRQANRITSEWGGGSGTTSLVCRYSRLSSDCREFVFQISVATILSKKSKFSWFGGCMRLHVLLQGQSILTVNGSVIRCAPLDPENGLFFSGEDNVTCELETENVQALNVIFKDGVTVFSKLYKLGSLHALSSLHIVQSKNDIDTIFEEIFYVFFCEQSEDGVTVRSDDLGDAVTLSQQDTLIVNRNRSDPAVVVNVTSTGDACRLRYITIGVRSE